MSCYFQHNKHQIWVRSNIDILIFQFTLYISYQSTASFHPTVEYLQVLVVRSCEITTKIRMIVVTEAWVLCEIDHTMLLQISFLFLVLLGLGLGCCNTSSKHVQIKKLLYNGKDRERSHKSELKSCLQMLTEMERWLVHHNIVKVRSCKNSVDIKSSLTPMWNWV